MNDITVIWVLIGVVIGIVAGNLILVLFDIHRLNKDIKKQKIERKSIEAETARYRAMSYEERAKAIGGTSFVTAMSRSLSEMQKRNLENQAKQNDKTG